MSENLNLEKTKVLIIDNDLGSLYLIKALLADMGCEVDFFDNIKDAIDKLKITKYDICFTDINLPIASGLQFSRFIRENISKDLPIIAVTASILPENKHICFEAGMNGFLSKPVNTEALKKEIKCHLNV